MKEAGELSIKELEEILAKKKQAEETKASRKKQAYERLRDITIEELNDEAVDLAGRLQRFKAKVAIKMEEQNKQLNEYGLIRSNSKGGFTITNNQGDMRIRRRLDSDPDWDERALKGVELVKEFLFDKVKKKDQNTFELLMTFLVKNKKGDLDYASVMQLLQNEKLYNDERWIEGLKLLREGYKLFYKGFSYDFQVKPNKGAKWRLLTLNFSNI
ncbi:DUF3164 family protein [Sphingobacterium hotanense]|uniref:DUF3164 family protein n=1 Tax=Sphingobacterium hotanense TaxID=649196 RepID=A0ABT7NLD7_9SPHI|nr:DUF3164 family protein [Sphingobacterium hotanense]MDM1048034.1 DUF3164 family protein [Sphingobacterium hotanense]